MRMYSQHEGEELVVAARRAAELQLITHRFDRKMIGQMLGPFAERYGIRVSFLHYPTDSPRGSHLDVDTGRTVKEKIIDAAVKAGFEDQAHVSLTPFELEHVVTKVDIISEPRPLPSSRTARLREVIPGRHGIMVHYGFKRGILMPGEAARHGWSVKRLMEEACKAAGLHENYWTQPMVKMFTFEAQTFRELSPDGKIAEVFAEQPPEKKKAVRRRKK